MCMGIHLKIKIVVSSVVPLDTAEQGLWPEMPSREWQEIYVSEASVSQDDSNWQAATSGQQQGVVQVAV